MLTGRKKQPELAPLVAMAAMGAGRWVRLPPNFPLLLLQLLALLLLHAAAAVAPPTLPPLPP